LAAGRIFENTLTKVPLPFDSQLLATYVTDSDDEPPPPPPGTGSESSLLQELSVEMIKMLTMTTLNNKRFIFKGF
jgi:hypothetical protein